MPKIRLGSPKLIPVLFIAMFVVLPNRAKADKLFVPQTYPTVQAAVDAAVSGDIIVIWEGVYSGQGNYNISTRGKALTITSSGSQTILDAEQLGRLFLITDGEARSTVISNLTLRNGLVDDLEQDGGAILINNSSPIIHNCHIIDNSLTGSNCGGAGIGIDGGAPLIENCVFAGNINSSGLGEGGGLSARHGAQVDIVGCHFINNISNSGGGLAVDGAAAVIVDSSFRFNESTSG